MSDKWQIILSVSLVAAIAIGIMGYTLSRKLSEMTRDIENTSMEIHKKLEEIY